MCYFQCLKYYLIITAIISCIIVYFIWKRVLGINMSSYNADEQLSDDEVYFGKLTLKELKKVILWDKYSEQQTSASAVNSPKKSDDDHDTSLKILQAHSQPNLMSAREKANLDYSDLNSSGFDIKPDDSFIKMENMVAKLCVSPKNNDKTEQLNNTLEVIEYILNNPPTSATKDKNDEVDSKKLENENCLDKSCGDALISSLERNKIKSMECDKLPEPPQNTPIKSIIKPAIHIEGGHTTPREIKPKPIFKTPAQPLSGKKPSATSLKKTPSRSNAYQHISSPVASYIRNCPIAPLVKDVHPKKPLPGPSSIPKFVKNPLPIKPSNKENVNLPSLAYKSAKKTKVIDMPDEQKLPQSHWTKKIMTSLPKPMVMKHDHRELNLAKKKLLSQNEDSFADLSCHQAEVSVCTQKSAFKSNLHKNV